jgi:hypothetical protein
VGKNHQFQFGWFGYNQPNWNWSPIFGTEQEQELECDFIFFNFLKESGCSWALFKYGTETGTKVL